MTDLTAIPTNPSRPVDDGACDHLTGSMLPDLTLPMAGGGEYRLRQEGRRVLYAYPRTGGPGIELPDDWDLIPGARGCTPQSCSFRDHAADLADLGVAVAGVSAQPISEQAEFAARMHIGFPLLNDSDLGLRSALALPTFQAAGLTLYKRVTVLVHDDVIRKVWYPVFQPDRNAAEVLAHLRRTGS